jgi:hypothetical protein
MSLPVAMLVAAFFAVFGFPFRRYQYWYSWSQKGSVTGLLIYLVLAGGGGGLVGWLPAQLGNAYRPQGAWIDGLIFGVAGSLAVRADFGSQGTACPGSQGAPCPPESPRTASALGKGIEWSAGMLDHVARLRARRWLGGLRVRDLLVVARDLIIEIKAMPAATVPPTAKAAILTKATDAMHTLSTCDDAELRDDARARLTQFCLAYMCGERVARPSIDDAR